MGFGSFVRKQLKTRETNTNHKIQGGVVKTSYRLSYKILKVFIYVRRLGVLPIFVGCFSDVSFSHYRKFAPILLGWGQ